MKRPALAILAAAALALTGCAGQPAAATYDSAEALRDAYVKAGGTCDDWKQENKVGGAAQSGSCDDAATISTYLTQDAVQARVAETKESMWGKLGGEWIVGENWIVNPKEGDDIQKLREKLGGTVVAFESAAPAAPSSTAPAEGSVQVEFILRDQDGFEVDASDASGKVVQQWEAAGQGDTVNFNLDDANDSESVLGKHSWGMAPAGSRVQAVYSGWDTKKFSAECNVFWNGQKIHNAFTEDDQNTVDCSMTLPQ